MFSRNVTWTANLVAIPGLILALVIMFGAFGGTRFEQGVAALLVLSTGEVFSLSFSAEGGWVKGLALVLFPVGLVVYFGALVVTIAGLS